MLLTSLFGRHRRERLVADLSQQVAEGSHNAVWTKVKDRVASMRLAEARGYVRARAASPIADEADRMLGGSDPVDSAVRSQIIAVRSQIIEEATDRVVTLVFRDLLNLPPRLRTVRRAA